MEEVGRLLPSVVGRHMQGAEWRLVQVLNALWPRAVGKGIAQQSRPVSFVSGTLTVATACPSWATQLGHMSEEVRAGINGFLGRRVVKKVRVRHTPNLVLGTDPRKMGTWTSEAGASKLAQLKPALELANLDPEVARVVEEAHARYFSEGKGPLPRPD